MAQYRSTMEIFAVVKVQAFVRMAPMRIHHMVLKIGVVRLQRLYRSLKFWEVNTIICRETVFVLFIFTIRLE
jgi:hypothetical protein